MTKELKKSPYRVVCYNRENEIISDSIPELGEIILYNQMADNTIKEEAYIFGNNPNCNINDLPLLIRLYNQMNDQVATLEELIALLYTKVKFAIINGEPVSVKLKNFINDLENHLNNEDDKKEE